MMKISEAMKALSRCLAMFGDVPVRFVEAPNGNPAIELQNVDSTKKNWEITEMDIAEVDAWLQKTFPKPGLN